MKIPSLLILLITDINLNSAGSNFTCNTNGGKYQIIMKKKVLFSSFPLFLFSLFLDCNQKLVYYSENFVF